MEATPKDSKRSVQLTTAQRTAIVAAHKEGVSQVKLAAEFGCATQTISNTLKRYRKHQSVENRPKSGRPKVVDERTQRLLCIKARRNPLWTYKQLGDSVLGQPRLATVRRILKASGLQKSGSNEKKSMESSTK